jgi:glutamate carboxypeptidase
MLPISLFIEKTADFVSLLTRLVQMESPTQDISRVNRVGAEVVMELSKLGAQISEYPQTFTGNHIVGRWNSTGIQPPFLLLMHMDTVHPAGTLQKSPCIEREGKLFGPGSQDMKSGIAMFLQAAKILQEKGKWPARPITALFTADEETGSMTSRPLIESLAKDAGLVLCLEPGLPNGALKTWRKGVGDFNVIVHGRASHAGAAHSDGRNAIQELAHQILRIQGWTDYERGTTLNVGLIEGGTAPNVVPAEARAVVDMRVMDPSEADRVLAQMQSLETVLEGTSIEVSGGLNRPPMPRDQRMVDTFQKARKIGAGLGLELDEGGTGGGSDANFAAPLSVPVLDGLGAIGEGQHSESEFVWIESLPVRAALLAAILTDW